MQPFVGLGLDVASKTGFCLYEPLGQGKARVRCGSWECRGRDFDEKVRSLSDQLAGFLWECRDAGRPVTRAAVEEPIRRLPVKRVRKPRGLFASETETEELASNPGTMLDLYALAGAAIAVLHQFKIRVLLVPVATWRTAFIKTNRAPKNVDKSRQWLKHTVRDEANRLGVLHGFHVPNMDASDAVGIAWWLAGHEGMRLAQGWGGKVAA